MNRIGIFVFYDTYGKVDNYVEFLLNSLRTIISKLIIIINGKIEKTEYKKFKKYSENIFIRENLGYDAGAYKDAFTKFLLNEKWEKWDEVILLNDTFYGPIYPWNDIFQEMENEDVDFWGLSKYPGGGNKLSTGKNKPAHIQGYFFVLRKRIFTSKFWHVFWHLLEYPKTYQEAIEKFEISFSVYFSEKGFKWKAFTDKGNTIIDYGKNPYLSYFEELIIYDNFPILKRKVICLENLDRAKRIIDYIKKNTNYNIELICSHIKRLCLENRIFPIYPFNSELIAKFYHTHNRIYIYGYGTYGKGIARYFEYKKWKYDGFIVTKNENNDSDVFVYNKMKFDLKDGVILALGERYYHEVYPIIKNKLSKQQIFCPEYD